MLQPPAHDAPQQPLGRGALPVSLQRFQQWTVLFALASLVFHAVMRLVLHRGGRLASPLSAPADRYGDYLIFVDKFRSFHTAEFFQVGFPINYPAPVALIFEFFFKYTQPHILGAFLTFLVLCFAVPCILFARALVRRGVDPGKATLFVAICFFGSWPFLLIFDRGNVEIAVWLSIAIAMWAYATGRLWTAAAFFGVAASLKLFPFVFLALFLSRRRIKHLLFGAATFFVVSIVSMEILGPTVAIAYNGIAFGLASFKRNFMGAWLIDEDGVDHSIFASYKQVMTLVFHHPARDYMTSLSIYLAVTAIGGILLYFLVIRKLPLLNQVLLLTIASIYFTAFSGDGTLIHLYAPLAMLVLLAIQAGRDGVRVPGLGVMLGCLVVCLSIETFLTFPANAYFWYVRLIGPLHCVALGVLLVTALRYPLGPALAEGRGETVLSEPTTDWVPRTA
jgi:hypothetical protein